MARKDLPVQNFFQDAHFTRLSVDLKVPSKSQSWGRVEDRLDGTLIEEVDKLEGLELDEWYRPTCPFVHGCLRAT